MKTKMRLKSSLALLLTLVMLFSVMSPMTAFAAGITVDLNNVGDNTKLTSKTDYNVVPGVTESHLVTHNKDGSNQVQSYVLEVDLSNPNVGILASYKNYMNNLAPTATWGMQTVRDQAVAAENYYKNVEKMPNFEVVGGINCDFFNMQTGAPLGSLVMNGVKYNETTSGGNSTYFAILDDGTAVIGSGAVPENAKEVVGGSNILVQDGIINPNIKANKDKFPRTSIGIKADGTVVFVTADGRQDPKSCGQTFEENAQQMLSLGCVTALQVDGGGSATLVSQHEGETNLSVRNSPSDGTERTVSTALLIYSNATSDGEFDHATVTPNNTIYTPGSTVEFTATAVDGAGASAELPAEGFFALADEAAGTIDSATGVFTAAADFTGDVTVNYMVGEAVKGSTTVSIVVPDTLYVASAEQAVGPGVVTDFGIVAKYQDRNVSMKSDDIDWSIVEATAYSFYMHFDKDTFNEQYINANLYGKFNDPAENNKEKNRLTSISKLDYENEYVVVKATVNPNADFDAVFADAQNIANPAYIATETSLNNTAGTFDGLFFTGTEDGAYNAKVTAQLVCNPELAPLVLTVFIGSKQVTIHDFEYVTGEENKDASNYVSTFNLPTYSDTWLKANNFAGYGNRKDLAIALDSQDVPFYMWPNAAVGDTTNTSSTATIVSAADGEPVRFGEHSLRIEFDFSNFNKASNANFYLRETATPMYRYEGSPTAIGVWVYAPEGTTAYHLYLQCAGKVDLEAGTNVTSYQCLTTPEAMGNDSTGISWTGWRYLEFDLTGTKGNTGVSNVGGAYEPYGQQTDNGIFWISYQPSNMGTDVTSDTIYIDDITLIYGANTSDTHNPTVSYIGDMSEQMVDGETVYTSNKNTFKAQYADFEDKYMTGINDEATKMYIDGVDVTDKCYIDAGNDEIYFYDAVLPDGEHVIEIEIADVFGNKTTEMRYFTIDSGAEDTEVSFVAANAPVLGEDFILDIVTNNAADIAAADIEIKVLSFFTSYWRNVTVEPAAGFKLDGEAVYNSIRDTLTFRVVKDDVAVFAARNSSNKIASIITKVPADTPESLEVTHRISKGALTYVSGATEAVAAFSGKVISTCAAPLTITTDTMLVGSAGGNIYVKDTDGNPVEGAVIAYADGSAELGVTDAEGKIFTDAFIAAPVEFALTATKQVEVTPADPDNNVDAVYNTLRSFTFKSQSFTTAGDDTGLPTYVKLNATKNPETQQSISWMANPLYTADKAIVLYAEKAEYDANGADTEFTQFNGVSYLSEMSTSGSYLTNYAVRLNSATITGLKADTEYVYKVSDGAVESEIKTFSTSRANVATDFFIIGDVQSEDTTDVANINKALAATGVNYDFGLQTGDLVDNGANFKYWDAVGSTFSNGVIGNTDIIHALGNHEYYGDLTAINSAHYFDLPGDRTDKAPDVYSVQYGNVYIASFGYLGMTGYKAAVDWLIADAAASNATWKILVMHQPPFYTNPGGATKGLRELISEAADTAGLDFVLSGHDHSYARTQPLTAGKPDAENGTVYIICGSTGEKGYDIVNEPAHYYANLNENYEAVYMTVKTTDTTFEIATYDCNRATGESTLIDSYTATKEVTCTENGHDYLYADGWLTCSVCSYTISATGFNGAVKDAATSLPVILENGTPVKNKWVEMNGGIYYLGADGVAVAGEQKIGDYNYKFDADGKLTTFAIVENGALVSNKWIETTDGVYYLGADGLPATGETKIGEYTYPFDEDGKLTKFAFVLDDGTLATNRWIGEQYYLGADGLPSTGEVTIGKYTYTFDEDGNFVKGALVKEGAYYYYYIAGNRQRGWHQIDGYWHYFDVRGVAESGIPSYAMATGKHRVSRSDSSLELVFTFDSNGRLIAGAWEELENGTVYYWGNNERLVGWQYIDGAIYYFGSDTYMVTGEQTIDEETYTFAEDGKLQLKDENFALNGLFYYFDEEGKILESHIEDHPYVKAIDEAVEPQIGVTGLTEGEHCETCGEIIVAQEIIPALEDPSKPEPPTDDPEPPTDDPEPPTDDPEPIVPVIPYRLGDLNRDDKVTAADARLALRIAAKLDPITDSKLFVITDVNFDGKITAADARLILRVAGKLDTF